VNKVRLNRDSAGSGDQIVGSALNPGYVADTKYKDNFDSNWILDLDKGVARLKNPSEHLKNYTVKLQPMMGCIAVAPPAHQAMRTGFLGSYGGNMDTTRCAKAPRFICRSTRRARSYSSAMATPRRAMEN